jgi:hypothetical protein
MAENKSVIPISPGGFLYVFLMAARLFDITGHVYRDNSAIA